MPCFGLFFNVCLHSRWLAEIRQLSRQTATGEWEEEFKFQRLSCKISFLFAQRRQSAPDSLRSGYQRWEKAIIGSFRHHNNCGSTRPSMAASKENKLPPSFPGFKSQRFLHESSHDEVSGTHNDEHVKQLSSDFHLWLLELFSLFENGRAFIIEDDSKNIYFCWLSCCKPSYL